MASRRMRLLLPLAFAGGTKLTRSFVDALLASCTKVCKLRRLYCTILERKLMGVHVLQNFGVHTAFAVQQKPSLTKPKLQTFHQ